MKTLKSKRTTPKITPARLRRMRKRLAAFAEDVFTSMPRTDQRARGATYLRGLLLDGKRKSIEPMAARLAAADTDSQGEGVRDLEQALQQFVNQSPWDPAPVRRRLAERMTAAIRPAAWVVDDTAFPKYGRHSVGVAPQYCGALGKVANCQGRRVDPRRHRRRVLPDRLAVVPAPRVGRRPPAAPQGPRARPRTAPPQVAACPGHVRRARRLGPDAPGGAGRRRLRRGRRVPAGPGATRARLRGPGAGHDQRLHPGCGARGRGVCGSGTPAGAPLPPATLVAARAGAGCRRAGGDDDRLAAGRRRRAAGVAVCRPAGASGRGHATPGGWRRGAAAALAAGRVARGSQRAGQVLAGQP
jgi:hypothetical protein